MSTPPFSIPHNTNCWRHLQEAKEKLELMDTGQEKAIRELKRGNLNEARNAAIEVYGDIGRALALLLKAEHGEP